MDNDTFFHLLVSKYPNFSEIMIENNVLKFQNIVLPLNSFMLQSLFNDYNDLSNDIIFFTVNDLFQLIYIHVSYGNIIGELKTAIARTAINNSITNEKLNNYLNIYFYLIKFQSYLNFELQSLLADFEKFLYILESKNDMDTYEIFLITKNKASSFSNSINEKKEKIIKLELKNNQQIAGYVNAFTILLTLLFMGLIMSLGLLVLIS